MSKLDQILEDALQALERGDTIEMVVSRYPEHADELRPILVAAVSIKNKNLIDVPATVVRRNRAKILQHAAKMREGRVKRRSFGGWWVSLRRVAVTLTVLIAVSASGTGLVRASSSTVPGDSLYPVKRTWEDMLISVTFDSNKREVLQLEQENERLDELQELFKEKRSASVDFSGLVTSQNTNQWSVSGINVLITPQTKLPQGVITVGTGVHVVGHAQSGFVQADAIELISLNEIATVSPVYSSPTSTPPDGNDSASTPEGEATQSISTAAPASTGIVGPVITIKPSESESKSFKGIVQSLGGNVWVINGVQVNITNAEISGVSSVGIVAKVEGYFNQDGVFIATRIELPEGSSGSNDSTGSTSGSSSYSSSGDVSPNATPGYHQDSGGNDNNNEQHITETQEPEH